MKIVMNENRVKVVNALKNADNAMSLRDISEVVGFEVKSGSVNALVNAGVIRKVGMKKVPVVSYREVAVYEMGDENALENGENEKKGDK